MLKIKDKDLLKFIYATQHIKIKKPRTTILPKQIRHPFQVINISSYPFWVGFSLFWIMLWFGLFFLNAEWANNALKKTIFDYHWQVSMHLPQLHTFSWRVPQQYFSNEDSLWDMYCELYLHSDWFETFCKIKTVPIIEIFNNSIFETLIIKSSTLSYLVYPFLYWLFDGLLDWFIIIYINFTWVMQTSIIDDFFYSITTSDLSMWSLAKFVMPLFFIFQVGCPFKFFSIGLTSSFLTNFFWMITGILVTVGSLICKILYIFPINYIVIFPLSWIFASVIRISSQCFLLYTIIINYLIYPLAVIILIAATWRWMSDISIEGNRGEHTRAVQQNLIWGAYLFMLTEIIIFITLFQVTGYFAINPSAEVSQMWEFPGIHAPYSIGLGFANLVLLLHSGWILQIARKRLAAYSDYIDYKRGGEKKNYLPSKIFNLLSIISNTFGITFLANFFKKWQEKTSFDGKIKKYFNITNPSRGVVDREDQKLLSILISNSANYILKTIILGVIFMIFQYIEYSNLTFSISSGIYGTCFYCLTGLHGFHVIVGLILLSICYYQFKKKTFALDECIFFWFSARYWQFVDFVWIFVWLVFYARWNSFWTLIKTLINLIF